MGLSQPKKNIARSALNLLSKGFWGDFYNPNFYNIVGIKGYRRFCIAGLFLGIRSENGGGFYGRFNLCEGQQMQAEPKIFYYDLLSAQSTLAG